jgi:hypothetical protein
VPAAAYPAAMHFMFLILVVAAGGLVRNLVLFPLSRRSPA